MQVRALATFNGRYGMIRAGTTFNAEPGYVKALNKHKGKPLVEVLSEQDADEKKAPGPGDNKSIPGAPSQGGKDKAGGVQAPSPAAGKPITSASLPAGPASTKKTSKRSGAGGRKGVVTPRKGKAKTSSTPASDPAAG